MKIFRGLERCVLSQGFGKENTSKKMLPYYQSKGLQGHNGWDWAFIGKTQDLYYDVSDKGKVLRVDNDIAGGIGLEIVSFDRTFYWKHRYWHLEQGSIPVQAGDEIVKGQFIGVCDNTGYSTGPHLHRDMKRCDVNGYTIDRNNGYFGCVDMAPYFQNIYVRDLVDTPKPPITPEPKPMPKDPITVEEKKSILIKIVEALKRLIYLKSRKKK